MGVGGNHRGEKWIKVGKSKKIEKNPYLSIDVYSIILLKP